MEEEEEEALAGVSTEDKSRRPPAKGPLEPAHTGKRPGEGRRPGSGLAFFSAFPRCLADVLALLPNFFPTLPDFHAPCRISLPQCLFLWPPACFSRSSPDFLSPSSGILIFFFSYLLTRRPISVLLQPDFSSGLWRVFFSSLGSLVSIFQFWAGRA